MEVFEVVVALLLGGAALAALARRIGAPYPALVRHRYELALRRAEQGRSGAESASPLDAGEQEADDAVVRAATQAQRRRLMALRADGTIGDTTFQRVEEEIDWAELDWSHLLGAGPRPDGPA